MIAPKIPLVQDGQILSTNLVNSMIGRIEYAADLLRQYKLIAGDEMYVEPHFDGTRVSYLQQVAGGAFPKLPITSFPGFPSNTNFRYNALVLPKKYKPGSAPTDPSKLKQFYQPFIDGFTIDPVALFETYGDAFLKGQVSGGGAMVCYFGTNNTILAIFGLQYLRLSVLTVPLTFQLVDFYYGEPPFDPPKDFYPTSIEFSIVDSLP